MRPLLIVVLLAVCCSAQLAPITYAAPVLSTIADVESTHAGLERGCTEANPLYGSRPSRARMYAITMPLALGVDILSHHLHRHHTRGWYLPAAVMTAAHGAAAVHNLRVAPGR
jgi:hypothetical protein